MPVTFSSDRFTVTGGKVEGTATSATTTSLTSTGAFTAFTAENLQDRVVWITSGTGADQFRNIRGKTNNDTIEVDEAWDTIPDATSTFLVGFDPGDLAAISAANFIIHAQGLSNSGGVFSGIGYIADCNSHITVGNNTTKTFLHFPKGAYNFSEPITTSDNTYPWDTNASVFVVNSNACLQFGNYINSLDAGYNGCIVTMSRTEASWDRRLLNTHTSSSCIVSAFASSFHHLGRNVSSGNTRGNLTIQWSGSCSGLVRDCIFGEGVQFRPFSANLDYKNSSFLNCDISLYAYATPPANVKAVSRQPVGCSSTSDDNGSVIQLNSWTILSLGHIPASNSSTASK